MPTSNLPVLCHTFVAVALIVAYTLTADTNLLGVLAGYAGGAVAQSTKKGA